MRSPPPLRHISDTALWVAVYRAQESERTDAVFRDPYASTLAGDRGTAICRCACHLFGGIPGVIPPEPGWSIKSSNSQCGRVRI